MTGFLGQEAKQDCKMFGHKIDGILFLKNLCFWLV